MDPSDLIARPSVHYPHPERILTDTRLSLEQKQRALATWEDGFKHRSQNKDDANDASGPDIEDVRAAREALDTGRKQLASGTRKLAGVFAQEAQALAAKTAIASHAPPRTRIHVVGPEDDLIAPEQVDKGSPLSGAPADAARGGIATAGAMTAGVGALAAIDVVVAAPLATALAGAGGVLGSVAGALASRSVRDQQFIELVREAQQRGYWLLTVEVASESEALSMQDALARSAARETIDHGGARQSTGHRP